MGLRQSPVCQRAVRCVGPGLVTSVPIAMTPRRWKQQATASWGPGVIQESLPISQELCILLPGEKAGGARVQAWSLCLPELPRVRKIRFYLLEPQAEIGLWSFFSPLRFAAEQRERGQRRRLRFQKWLTRRKRCPSLVRWIALRSLLLRMLASFSPLACCSLGDVSTVCASPVSTPTRPDA